MITITTGEATPFDHVFVDSLETIKEEIGSRHSWLKHERFSALLVSAKRLRGLVCRLAQNSISTIDGRAIAIQKKLEQSLVMCRASCRVADFRVSRSDSRYLARRASSLGLSRITVNGDESRVFVAWDERLVCGWKGKRLRASMVVRSGFDSYWKIREAMLASEVRGMKIPLATCSRDLLGERKAQSDWTVLLGWFRPPTKRIPSETLRSVLSGASLVMSQFVLTPETLRDMLDWRGTMRLRECGLRELRRVLEYGSQSWHSATARRWGESSDELAGLLDPLLAAG